MNDFWKKATDLLAFFGTGKAHCLAEDISRRIHGDLIFYTAEPFNFFDGTACFEDPCDRRQSSVALVSNVLS